MSQKTLFFAWLFIIHLSPICHYHKNCKVTLHLPVTKQPTEQKFFRGDNNNWEVYIPTQKNEKMKN